MHSFQRSFEAYTRMRIDRTATELNGFARPIGLGGWQLGWRAPLDAIFPAGARRVEDSEEMVVVKKVVVLRVEKSAQMHINHRFLEEVVPVVVTGQSN